MSFLQLSQRSLAYNAAPRRHRLMRCPVSISDLTGWRLVLVGQRLLRKRWVAQTQTRYARSLLQFMHGAAKGQSQSWTRCRERGDNPIPGGLDNTNDARPKSERDLRRVQDIQVPLVYRCPLSSPFALSPKALTLFLRVGRRPRQFSVSLSSSSLTRKL